MVISPGGSGVEEGCLVVVQRLCWWPVGRWTANIDNAAPPPAPKQHRPYPPILLFATIQWTSSLNDIGGFNVRLLPLLNTKC